MDLIFAHSFDNKPDVSEFFSSTYYISYPANAPNIYGVQDGFRIGTTSSRIYIYTPKLNHSDFTFGAWIHATSSAITEESLTISFYTDEDKELAVTVKINGEVSVVFNGNDVASALYPQKMNNKWVYLAVEITFGSHINVYLDSIKKIDEDFETSFFTTHTFIQKFGVKKSNSYPYMSMTHITIHDDTYLGPIYLISAYPDHDLSTYNLTRYPASADSDAEVLDGDYDGDNSYVSVTDDYGSNQLAMRTNVPTALDYKSILGVQLEIIAKDVDGNGSVLDYGMDEEQYGQDTLTANYTTYTVFVEDDPRTGSAWQSLNDVENRSFDIALDAR